MSMRVFWLSAWEWRLSTIIFCLVLLVAYGAAWHFKPARKAAMFLAGWVLLFLTLSSPLHELSDNYLFSAHMVMHLLLLLIIPLLLIRSFPESLKAVPDSANPGGRQHHFVDLITHPAVTWAAGLGAMWIWHQPTIFGIAHENDRVHELQIGSLLVAGIMFWWPIAGPQLHRRLAPLPASAYLFTACLGCTLLGIGITFAPTGLFPVYNTAEDPYGIRPVLQKWTLTPKVDQQFGGLLMWVPPCLFYATGIMVQLMRLYRGETTPAQQREGAAPSADTRKRS